MGFVHKRMLLIRDFIANGHGAVAEDGSNGESSPVTDKPSNERDTIRITGQLQNCEAAKEAMMVRNRMLRFPSPEAR